jgi:hypothetical protein
MNGVAEPAEIATNGVFRDIPAVGAIRATGIARTSMNESCLTSRIGFPSEYGPPDSLGIAAKIAGVYRRYPTIGEPAKSGGGASDRE